MSEGAGAFIDPASEFVFRGFFLCNHLAHHPTRALARLLAAPSLDGSEVLDCRVLRDHVVPHGGTNEGTSTHHAVPTQYRERWQERVGE